HPNIPVRDISNISHLDIETTTEDLGKDSLLKEDAGNELSSVSNQHFASWLLQIGEDHVERHANRSDYIKLPNDLYISSQNLHNLIYFIYPNHLSNSTNSLYLLERGILAPKNTDVAFINSTIMNLFPGDEIDYLSADSIEETADSN
ncbi:8246_t:CDS:2, partial [Racocetra fulgida]